MAHMEQVRDPDLSLWQSAVDEVVAKKTTGTQAQSEGEAPVVQRPDPSNQMVQGAAIDVVSEAKGQPVQVPPGGPEAAQRGPDGASVLYNRATTCNRHHQGQCGASGSLSGSI